MTIITKRTLVFVFLMLGMSAKNGLASPKTFELKTGFGIGVPAGISLYDGPYSETTQPIIIVYNARLRVPKTLSLGLEFNVIVPSGYGVNILFDVVKTDKFRLHIIDPGIFWNYLQPVSVGRIKRKVDITLGFGAEYTISHKWTVTLDGRAFMMEPINGVLTYGDFFRPMGKESMLATQVCFGFSFRWGRVINKSLQPTTELPISSQIVDGPS